MPRSCSSASIVKAFALFGEVGAKLRRRATVILPRLVSSPSVLVDSARSVGPPHGVITWF